MVRLITNLILLAILWPATAYSQEKKQNSSINIGLVLRDTSGWSTSVSLLHAYVDKANRQGGYKNKDFKLVVRTTKGPWGTGSKQSVALVYEDEVCAILGLQYGRDAHLTEQVAAKAHVSYIECLATENTLSQAFVPHFFRIVPNDNQQAEAIAELIEQRGGGKIGILSQESYDTQYAVKSLAKATSLQTAESPLVIHVDASDMSQQKIIEVIRQNRIKHLIIPFYSEGNGELLNSINKELPDLLTYGTLHFTQGLGISKAPLENFEGMYLVSLGPIWIGGDYLWGLPSMAASADAVNLVIQAVRAVGTDREAIKNYLAEIETEGYHTGPLSFDNMGNRTRKIVFSKIQNGEQIIHYY
jgi:ABC-type branched-subunit amino acid transport system substrate-binding protein